MKYSAARSTDSPPSTSSARRAPRGEQAELVIDEREPIRPGGGRGDHARRFRGIERRRLLAEDVTPGRERVDRLLRVAMGRGHDDRQIGARPFEDLAMIGRDIRDPELRGRLPQALEARARQADHLRAGHMPETGEDHVLREPLTEDDDAYRFHDDSFPPRIHRGL